MTIKLHEFFIALFTLVFFNLGYSQVRLETTQHMDVVSNYLNENRDKYNLEESDLEDLFLNDQHFSESTELTHLYINQGYQGKRIFNGISSVAVKEGKVFYFANRFLDNLQERVLAQAPAVAPQNAIQHVANLYDLGQVQNLEQIHQEGYHYTFSNAGISSQNIHVELVYVERDTQLILAWDFIIYKEDNSNWWSVRVDATTGDLIDAYDLILTCKFEKAEDHSSHNHKHNTQIDFYNQIIAPATPLVDGSSYNVFALPVESPNHGSRQIVTNPADTNASPFGWHDIDGVTGAEFTITQGNNVLAKEDANGDNENSGIGFSPDGTATLNFDFPLDFNLSPFDYQEAAITNLFYTNNMMHDIWYNHGFNEEAGNFQQTNYTGAGIGQDFVVADAQDGSGFNNANFGTPPDGFNPRMQMFLWTPPGGGNTNDRMELVLNGSVAAEYAVVGANFGADLSHSVPLTGQLALVQNVPPNPNNACQPIVNPTQLNGNIAVLRRGGCEFGTKVLAAENAGAIAVVVVNNEIGTPIAMPGGTDGGAVTIPSVMIEQGTGESIISALQNGTELSVNLIGADLLGFIDGDFDNVIVAHEYGHGISNRLAGGPSTTSCLFNDEQMGEGWSDWFGLMITMTAADLPETGRGIGTFARSQPTTGQGIRPARYSTDFSVNPATYNDSNVLSQPHGIGFVWASVIWDLTWAYIDKYGFDPDLYNGTGGNNRIMQLVIDGLKLQPCQPGFIDGRDALLAADIATTGGEDQCMIWEVFAARGLGVNAQQGSSQDRADQVEDFTLPPSDDPSLANCSSLSNEDLILDNLSIYPNPTETELIIRTPTNLGEVLITLMDMNGRVVYTSQSELFDSVSINTAALKAGLYILNIKGDDFDYNEKIIKN
jgi:extracellular elastinolytic metalloproteinase